MSDLFELPSLRVTETPNFGFNLPDVGGDWDQWGDQINANFSYLDGVLLPITGGRMTGLLVLSGNPAEALGAVTKQYADQGFALLANYLPLSGGNMTGALGLPGGTGANLAMTVGGAGYGFWRSSTAFIFQAGGTALLTLNPTLSQFSGPLQMGGPLTIGPGYTLTLAQNPTGNLEAATKQYVDSQIAASGVTSFNTRSGAVTLTGADVSGVGALMLAGGTMTGALGLAADPTTNTQAATKHYVDTTAATVAAAAAAPNDGRNLFHNPMFNVQQRGVGNWTTSGAYTADRWVMLLNTDTATVNLQSVADSVRTQIGDESFIWALHNTFTGNAAAAAFNFVAQRVENLRRLAGKTITVSFWAQASAALNLGVGLTQVFGTGGSPSAQASMAGQSVALTTSFQRYSVSFAVPTSIGKAFGTNNDDYTQISFWFSSGATNAVQAGSPGVQSGVVYLMGMQLEIAGAATALDKPHLADDWARCLRYFQYHPNVITAGYQAAGGNIITPYPYGTRMRITPAATLDTATYLNASGANVAAYPTYVRLQCNATAAGAGWASFNLTLNADL